MEIRPLKTEADYECALAKIEKLWGAEANTPAGDTLDVLLTLVDAYESEHYPGLGDTADTEVFSRCPEFRSI